MIHTLRRLDKMLGPHLAPENETSAFKQMKEVESIHFAKADTAAEVYSKCRHYLEIVAHNLFPAHEHVWLGEQAHLVIQKDSRCICQLAAYKRTQHSKATNYRGVTDYFVPDVGLLCVLIWGDSVETYYNLKGMIYDLCVKMGKTELAEQLLVYWKREGDRWGRKDDPMGPAGVDYLDNNPDHWQDPDDGSHW